MIYQPLILRQLSNLAQPLTLLTSIREELGSNLGQGTYCPNSDLSWFSFNLPWRMSRYDLKYSTTVSFPIFFNSSFRNYPITRPNMLWAAYSAVK
jgi:hypothetical protein